MSRECDKCCKDALDFHCQPKECIGFFGKILGHSFRRFLKKERYVQQPNISFEIHGTENAMAFVESQRNIYSIKCKRCGLELN
ncbi:MAG: hypothetical protein AABY22_34235 [Nanoarchaeota archaeon]